MKSAFSIIVEYHPSAYLLLRSREKWQKVHNFKRFGVFTLASASAMLEASKEKAALWAAESLVVGFSCEVEVQGIIPVVLDVVENTILGSLLLRSGYNSDKWHFNAWFRFIGSKLACNRLKI